MPICVFPFLNQSTASITVLPSFPDTWCCTGGPTVVACLLLQADLFSLDGFLCFFYLALIKQRLTSKATS